VEASSDAQNTQEALSRSGLSVPARAVLFPQKSGISGRQSAGIGLIHFAQQ
jgi:hypothetical protein